MDKPEVNIESGGLYERLGGRELCRSLSTAFYARVARDPILRPLFPGKSLRCAVEQFAAFLVQFLGGPGEDAQERWWLSLRESHMRFKIGPEERAAWLRNMTDAFDDVSIAEPMRTELLAFFDRSSAYVAHGEDSSCTGPELSHRWEGQMQVDAAVAAIHRGDAERGIALAESEAIQVCSRSVHAGLLALMIRSGCEAMVRYAGETVAGDGALVHKRIRHGRTLLHEAAAAGSVVVTELLLSMGAKFDSRDGGGHTPLYCVSNECGGEGGAKVVRALVRAGADVNARENAKRCTPLHMAARRGYVEIAEALLGCGGEMEARDSAGDTPLRRAVNCNQVEVAALLVARGAEVGSMGSKGATPVSAARSIAMRKVLQGGGL